MYDKVRREVLATIDSDERIVGGGLPTKDSLRTAGTAARCVPKAPTIHDDLDLSKMPYKNGTAEQFLLRRSSRPGEDKDILLLGTQRNVRQFVNSSFKSGDATFSCAPKLFYQVSF